MTAHADRLTLAVPAVGDLDVESAASLRATFLAFFDQVEDWDKRAKAISVTDVDQKRDMKLARESRLALRDIRLSVEAARKRLKEDSLRKGKAIDGIANVLKGLIEPIEAYLLEQETFAARAEADRKRAEDARVAELLRQADEAEAAEARERERLERARVENERAAREDAQRQENERLRQQLAERDAAAKVEREKREALERQVRAATPTEPAPAADERARAEQAHREAIAKPTAIEPPSSYRNAIAKVDIAPPDASLPVPIPVAPPTIPFPEATARAWAHAPAWPGAPELAMVAVQDLPNGSASAAERTMACSASLALPRVNRSTKYSNRGHGIHGYIRAVLAGVGQGQALAAVDEEYRSTCRLVDWRKLCAGLTSLRVEVAYAIDLRARTARFLGENIGRAYAAAAIAQGRPLGEWEVPGSLDIEGVSAGGPVVVDVKSGFQDVTPAEENGQGLFFGSVKYLLEGASEVEFRIAKLKPNGDVWIDRAVYTAWQLDAYLDDYEAAIERVKRDRRVYLAGGTPDVNEGPWCGYCACANACPAKTRMARAMIGELGKLEAALGAMSDEQLGHAYEVAHDRAKPILDRVLEAAKERVMHGSPLPLSGGLELREVAYPKTTLHGDSLLALAEQLGATPAQLKGCYRETTVRQARACKAPHAARRKAG